MMSRFTLAPPTISSRLRRRNSSSGSPVRTWICQGCVFIDDGARLATSMRSSITARATGCFLNPRTLLRVWTSVSKSIRCIPIVSPDPDLLCGGLAGCSRGQHHIGALLADHDRRRIGVAARQRRHDRRVGNAQALDAVHAQFAVDDGKRIRPHLAGSDRMIGGLGIVADPVEQLLVAPELRAG